ncbi:MAG: elongation factor G [Nitrospinota bacterium]
MANYQVAQVRTVGVLGEGGSGKTSLCEALLYCAGSTDRLGRVDNGSSPLDYEPEEIQRRSSLGAALCFCDWKKHRIHLVDTPGYANFAADTIAAMRVVDAALVVVPSYGDLKVQSEKVWGWAREEGIPALAFVTAMDHERADFSGALERAQKAFGARMLPFQLPLRVGGASGGIVDLVTGKAFRYAGDESGRFEEVPVPDEIEGEVETARGNLTEAAAETDDALLEKYLEGGGLSPEEVRTGLRKGVLGGSFCPVFCGSGLKNVGAAHLLDALLAFAPTPAERELPAGKRPGAEERVAIAGDAGEPFSGLVFKTVVDPFAGKLNLFRVFSGSPQADSSVLNASRGERERLGQLYLLLGKNQKPTRVLVPGELGAVAKLKVTATGDTLCEEKRPVSFEPIRFPEPAISFAVSPKSKGDEEKLSTGLGRLLEEDRALRVGRDPQTKELLVSGMGALHVEVVIERLRRKFNVAVELKTPRVPYKETIRGTAKVQGKYKKQTGGRGQYGDTWVEVEPLPRGKGFEFVDRIVGGVIPRQFIPAVEKGIVEAMGSGPLAGYPVTDVRVTLYDGSYHSVDSSELAFKIAGSVGFKKGVMGSRPGLLEPIMNLEVTVPDEMMGDIIGDLNARRGRVLGVVAAEGRQIIRAQVPMAEVLTYDSALRSMTGGRGDFTVEFSHYEEVPAQVAEKIIAQANARREQ